MGKGESKSTAKLRTDPMRWVMLFVKRLAYGVMAVVAVVFVLFWLASRPPEFYSRAIATEETTKSRDSNRFELGLSKLQKLAYQQDSWQVQFDEAAWNAWSQKRLLNLFPEAIPSGTKPPIVQFGEQKLRVAIEVELGVLNVYLCVEGDLFCTEQSRQVAIQFDSASVGWLPIPIGLFADWFDDVMSQQDFQVQWLVLEDSPTALVVIPDSALQMDEKVFTLTAFQFSREKVLIQGVSQESLSESTNRKRSKLDL